MPRLFASGFPLGFSSARQRASGPTSPSPPRRPPEGASGDAVLRWGRPSNFVISAKNRTSNIVSYPTQPEEEEEEGLVYQEVERTTTTVRVENPDDSEQFVDVERIDRITFLGPDNIPRTFVLTN